MDYEVDLDPRHSVIRVTVSARIVTLGLAEDIYTFLSRVSSSGGPYAAIYDLSAVADTMESTDQIRGRAKLYPAVPGDRVRVLVAKEPVIYGLSRLIELTRDSMGVRFEVVHTLEEAYEIVKARPEDFTQRIA